LAKHTIGKSRPGGEVLEALRDGLQFAYKVAREGIIEANRKRATGTREKVRSKGINLEGNTHAQEINVSQLPV
jgi:hypothetical protein